MMAEVNLLDDPPSSPATVIDTTGDLLGLEPVMMRPEEPAKAASPAATTTTTTTMIDTTLLLGLEPVMSPDEQARVTAMMVSGNPNEVAKGSKILHDLARVLKEHRKDQTCRPVLVHQRTETHQLQIEQSFRVEMKPKEATQRIIVNNNNNNKYQTVAEEKKENDLERRQRAHALPLPVRMPRCVTINAFDPNGTPVERKKLTGATKTKVLQPSLTFVDDEWDGTLGAAFTKLVVAKKQKGIPIKLKLPTTRRGRQPTRDHDDVKNNSKDQPFMVKHQELQPSPGFDEIVNRMDGGYAARLGVEGDNRVLIATTHNDALKLGLQRGDVVTHVNGEEFSGGTADDLNILIQAHYQSHGPDAKLELVVNAEPCIAQALKLRALG